jgi:hypothetical protein
VIFVNSSMRHGGGKISERLQQCRGWFLHFKVTSNGNLQHRGRERRTLHHRLFHQPSNLQLQASPNSGVTIPDYRTSKPARRKQQGCQGTGSVAESVHAKSGTDEGQINKIVRVHFVRKNRAKITRTCLRTRKQHAGQHVILDTGLVSWTRVTKIPMRPSTGQRSIGTGGASALFGEKSLRTCVPNNNNNSGKIVAENKRVGRPSHIKDT